MKKAWIFLSAFALTLILLLLFLPQMLSTDWGKSAIVKEVGKRSGGTLEIGSLSLSWFHKQKLESVRYTQPDVLLLSFDALTSDCSLMTLLMRKGDVGRSLCTNLELQLKTREEKVQEASSNNRSRKSEKLFPMIWKNYSGIFEVAKGRITLHRESAPSLPIDLSSFYLKVNPGIFPLSIQSEGRIGDGPYHLDCVLGMKKRYIDADIRAFPLALLGKTFTDALGETLNLEVKPKADEILVSIITPRFSMTKTPFDLKDGVTLLRPTPFHYEQLTSKIPIQGNLKELNVPLIDWKQMALVADLQSSRFDLNAFSLLSPRLNISKERASSQFDLVGMSQLSCGSGLQGYAFLCEDLMVKIKGKGSVTAPSKISDLSLDFSGKNFSCRLDGAMNQEGLEISKPLFSRVAVQPMQMFPTVELAKEAIVDLEVAPTTLFFHSPLALKARAKMEAIALKIQETPFSLQDIQTEIQVDGLREKYALEISGKQGAGSFTAHFATTGPWDQIVLTPAEVRVNCENVSTEFLSAYFDQRLTANLLGPTCGLNYEIQPEKRIVFGVNSDKLSFDSTFRFQDDHLVLSRPVRLSLANVFNVWESFDSLDKSSIRVESLSKMDASLSSLSIPIQKQFFLFPILDLNFFPIQFDARLNIDNLKLKNTRLNQTGSLSYLDLTLSKAALGGGLEMDLDGKVDPSGSIKGFGNIQNLFAENGGMDFSRLSTSLQTRFEKVPSLLLDALSTRKELPPSAILGTSLSGECIAHLEKGTGDIEGKIDASNCNVMVSAQMNQGIITLKKPLQGAMVLTDQLRATLAAKGKVALLPRREPIKLFVSDSGFSLPAKNFSLAGLTFSYGRLDLGQILLKNRGSISAVADIFRLSSFSDSLSLWFAPAEMSMNNGKMRVKRTEILFANTYEVALWGKINFRKRFVDMILGLTAGSLRAAFGVSGLSPSYVLKVPIRGPFEAIEVDKGAAISRIALLIGRKNIAPQAGVFGNVLGVIGELADDQSDIPPPRPPYPWSR